jgi:organic hydroperoxide reductase OsmC/OhrA
MSTSPPYFYDTEVEWTGDRKGDLRSPHLSTLVVAPPPEFNGPEGFWTPEHLYVASVNACFMSTFLAIAQLSSLRFARFTCAARGKLERDEGRGYRVTEIVLRPKLVLSEARDRDRAVRILEKAERNCLISNSINTTVRIEPEIALEDVQVKALAGKSSL